MNECVTVPERAGSEKCHQADTASVLNGGRQDYKEQIALREVRFEG